MKTITKKIWPKFFNDVLYFNKRFEIRKDEDDIQPDDTLILVGWNPLTLKYTGKKLICSVLYVFRSNDYEQDFGIKPGCCVIGFAVKEYEKQNEV